MALLASAPYSPTLTVKQETQPLQTSKAVMDWGDMDGDGHPDLAVATPVEGFWSAPVRVYRNDPKSGQLLPDPAWQALQGATAEARYASSVSWGDVDNDGRPDLAVGYSGRPTRVYTNDGGRLSDQPAWSSGNDNTGKPLLTWADVDGDGGLDLVQVNRVEEGMPVFIYLNRGRPLSPTPSAESDAKPANSTSLAWGDVDGDGRLELAVGRSSSTAAVTNAQQGEGQAATSSGIYRVKGKALQLDPELWSPKAISTTTSLAWGDVDGDGHLDLAVGNMPASGDTGNPSSSGATQVYLNEGNKLSSTPAIELKGDGAATVAVEWGDINRDGALDLIVGKVGAPAQIYFNHPDSKPAYLRPSPEWRSQESGPTSDIALGDLDNDGGLDLVVADFGSNRQIRVYLNRGNGFGTTASYSLPSPNAYSIALGDMDGDGYLDLAVGTSGAPKRVYRNVNGRFQAAPTWVSSDADLKSEVAWGDVNGDGFPDLAAGYATEGTGASATKVYLNQHGTLASSASWSPESPATNRDVLGDYPAANDAYAVAWGDANGDGLLDLAVASGAGTSDKLYLNGGVGSAGSSPGATRVCIGLSSDPATTCGGSGAAKAGEAATPLAPADFYSTPTIRDASVISITYALTNTTGAPVRMVRAFYSTNGGGSWQPALSDATGTNIITSTLAGGPLVPGTDVYPWSVLASGFLGQSDNVVFRLEAYPSLQPMPGSVANTYRSAYVATQTYPFRVRGSQVRVLDENNHAAAGALVYRLPEGQVGGGKPIGTEDGGSALETNSGGYLQGQGRISKGDRLIALQPITDTSAIAWYKPNITDTHAFTLYHTSAAPIPTGLDAYTVTKSGLSTLTASSEHPLLLFNLDVSLEWDARNDGSFLADLGRAIQHSSELLYEVTNGQAALGDVRIFQNKENWNDGRHRHVRRQQHPAVGDHRRHRHSGDVRHAQDRERHQQRRQCFHPGPGPRWAELGPVRR